MKRLLCVLLLTALVCGMSNAATAAGLLDEITYYEITVSPRNDGTLDIGYHLEWKVLDDKKEGPLTWIKVGIPNKYADELSAKGVSIRSIRSLNDGGSYVRLDLDRPYAAGETAVLDFSLHQKHMLSLEDNAARYSFIPGWFDEIHVRSISILWNGDGAVSSNASRQDDSQLIWSAALAPGEKLSAWVMYPMDAFQVTGETEKLKQSASDSKLFDILGGLVALLIILGLLRKIKSNYRGGFGGPGIHGGTSHGCACACACGCACACACAGGGRAGCAAKPFYKPVLTIGNLKKALQAEAGQNQIS